MALKNAGLGSKSGAKPRYFATGPDEIGDAIVVSGLVFARPSAGGQTLVFDLFSEDGVDVGMAEDFISLLFASGSCLSAKSGCSRTHRSNWCD